MSGRTRLDRQAPLGADAEAPEPRRLADYIVNKEDRGRSRVWMILWLAVGPTFRSGLGGSWLRVLVLRAFGAQIGRNCRLHPSFRVHFPWKLSLGDLVDVAKDVWIINPEPVAVGANCRIGQNVILCAGGHDHLSPVFTRTSEPVKIGEHCTIDEGATVLKGVVLPPGSRVKALAVVVKGESKRQGAES